MGPTPQAPQETAPRSPKLCAVNSSQMHAYSQSGPIQQTQSPQEAQLVNTRLIEELRAVVIMNDKWQKYHKQQENYIKDLQIRLDQQKLMTEESDNKYSHVLITQRLQEQKIKDQDDTIKCFGSLMEELDNAHAKIQRLQAEILESRQTADHSQVRDERVELLQYQLQVCIEDFKKEETQKDRLQQKVASLTSQLEEANQVLAEYREKVNFMKSISFPTIHKASVEVNSSPKEKHVIHRRRTRMSTSAPTNSIGSCRLDGIVNFPATIEADSCTRQGPRGFELAPKFSSSLESEEADDVESFNESLEMIRH